jgi:hypothetical protein
MDELEITRRTLPLGLKIAAVYLLLSGAADIIAPLVLPPVPSSIPIAMWTAANVGAWLRQYAIGTSYLVAGAGILRRKAWAWKLAIAGLVVPTPHDVADFAWGMARGRPILAIQWVVACVVVIVWHGFWLYVICRKSSRDAFFETVETPGLHSGVRHE